MSDATDRPELSAGDHTTPFPALPAGPEGTAAAAALSPASEQTTDQDQDQDQAAAATGATVGEDEEHLVEPDGGIATRVTPLDPEMLEAHRILAAHRDELPDPDLTGDRDFDRALRKRMIQIAVAALIFLLVPLWLMPALVGPGDAPDTGSRLALYARHLAGEPGLADDAEDVYDDALKKPMPDGGTLLALRDDTGDCWLLVVDSGPPREPARGLDTDCDRD